MPPQVVGLHDEDLPLLGETFAVEYCNSHYVAEGEDLDCLADEQVARSWFRGAVDAGDIAVPDRLGPDVLRDLRRVRDAVRGVALEVADAEGDVAPGGPTWRQAATVIQDFSARARTRITLRLDGDRPAWRLHLDGSPEDVLVATVATRCALFLGGDEVGRLRRCARPACPMLFVRHHAARRFCSTGCAHSERQRRYYRRRVAGHPR